MTRRHVGSLLVAVAVLAGCTEAAIDAAVDEFLSAVPDDGSSATVRPAPRPSASPSDTTSRNASPPFRPPVDTERVTVDRVVDGDTLVVFRENGDRDRVRLLRIDTPELARDGSPAECLAQEATAQLDRFSGPGTELLLATDVEIRDRFDRLLAHAWRADDGVWVNGGMLATGFARVVTFPPNTAWDDEVLALQAVARDRGVGLWSRC